MNPMTGELIANPFELTEEQQKIFKQLPDYLSEEARLKLASRNRAMTDISDDSELSEWARQEREKRVESPDGQAAQRRLRQLERQLAKTAKP